MLWLQQCEEQSIPRQGECCRRSSVLCVLTVASHVFALLFRQVDAPMKIYVVLAPSDDSPAALNRYRFIKKPIHRPIRTGRKAKPLDPSIELLLGSRWRAAFFIIRLANCIAA